MGVVGNSAPAGSVLHVLIYTEGNVVLKMPVLKTITDEHTILTLDDGKRNIFYGSTKFRSYLADKNESDPKWMPPANYIIYQTSYNTKEVKKDKAKALAIKEKD